MAFSFASLCILVYFCQCVCGMGVFPRHLEGDSVIPNEYIVVAVNNEMPNDSLNNKDLMMKLYSLKLKRQVVLGNRVFMTVEGNREAVQKMAAGTGGVNMDVVFTEPVRVVHAFTLHEVTGLLSENSTFPDETTISTTADLPECTTQQVGNIWGLDRTDQREPLTSSERVYTYGDGDSGSGVNVYVVDSGIYYQHPDFEGRARWGYTTDNMDGDDDLNGHGTHVAGIVGSRTYGIAKGSTLIAVKVLNADGVGRTDGILAAFQWIANDYITSGRPKSVINLSLGVLGISQALDAGVKNLIEEGIPTVVAAGNEYSDACNFSPARVPNALTVGASDKVDDVTYFSNWGTCLDLFAPGNDIRSTYISGEYSQSISGTSQAAPHVTGVVARYLSTLGGDTTTPAAVTEWVLNMSSKNRIVFQGNAEATSPNRLLHMHCYNGDRWQYDEGSGSGRSTRVVGAQLLAFIVSLMTLIQNR